MPRNKSGLLAILTHYNMITVWTGRRLEFSFTNCMHLSVHRLLVVSICFVACDIVRSNSSILHFQFIYLFGIVIQPIVLLTVKIPNNNYGFFSVPLFLKGIAYKETPATIWSMCHILQIYITIKVSKKTSRHFAGTKQELNRCVAFSR